jgi:hypothetical protein
MLYSRPIRRILLGSGVIAFCVVTAASSGQATASNRWAETSANESSPFCRHRVRTVSEKVAVRFLTDKSSYSPGESATFRVDNVGGTPVRPIGEYFSLERFVNGSWSLSPESRHIFSRVRLGILEPGKSGFCRRFPISSDIAPGHYRFRKIVTVQPHKQRQLTADFHINPEHTNYETETTTGRPWYFRQQLGRLTVEIFVTWPSCSLKTVPTIHADVIERPGRAVITTRVYVPPPPPGKCLRLLRRQDIRVRLDRPVAALKLFDGSYSPPRLRWPV